jgi:hypothetical protein
MEIMTNKWIPKEGDNTIRILPPENYRQIYKQIAKVAYGAESTISDDEIRKAWKSKGQGHDYAVERKSYFCVVVGGITVGDALVLCRAFLNFFNMPSCTHWNGKTLSLYCGEAGSGAEALKRGVEGLVTGYKLGKGR